MVKWKIYKAVWTDNEFKRFIIRHLDILNFIKNFDVKRLSLLDYAVHLSLVSLYDVSRDNLCILQDGIAEILEFGEDG